MGPVWPATVNGTSTARHFVGSADASAGMAKNTPNSAATPRRMPPRRRGIFLIGFLGSDGLSLAKSAGVPAPRVRCGRRRRFARPPARHLVEGLLHPCVVGGAFNID